MQLTLINKLLLLNRKTKQLVMILVDSVLVVFGLLSAFSIRLGYWIWPQAEIQYVIESWIIVLLMSLNHGIISHCLIHCEGQDRRKNG